MSTARGDAIAPSIIRAVDREPIARARRRQAALDSLEAERDREQLLRARLDETIGDAEGWRVDEDVLARLDADDAALLRDLLFAADPPDEEAAARFEQELAELQSEIAESRRRQDAFERYLDALDASG